MERMTWKEFVEGVYNLPVDYGEVWDVNDLDREGRGWEIHPYAFGTGPDEYTCEDDPEHHLHLGDDYTGEDYYITDGIGDMYVVTHNGILIDGPYVTYEEAEKAMEKLEKEEA